jgi:hypothetical protein
VIRSKELQRATRSETQQVRPCDIAATTTKRLELTLEHKQQCNPSRCLYDTAQHFMIQASKGLYPKVLGCWKGTGLDCSSLFVSVSCRRLSVAAAASQGPNCRVSHVEGALRGFSGPTTRRKASHSRAEGGGEDRVGEEHGRGGGLCSVQALCHRPGPLGRFAHALREPVALPGFAGQVGRRS